MLRDCIIFFVMQFVLDVVINNDTAPKSVIMFSVNNCFSEDK